MDNTYKKKKGFATDDGVKFQVGLLTVFLLNALQKLTNWRISTENEEAGKFDDVVIEMSDKSAILLQAKHRRNNKITYNELLLGNNDFSLAKYYLSYQEVRSKFKVKHMIICTNAGIDKNCVDRKVLRVEEVDCDSILCCAEYSNSCFYMINDHILPTLKESVKEYYFRKHKKQIHETTLTDDNLKEFLEHFQFYINYPSNSKLDSAIERLLSTLKVSDSLWSEISSQDIQSKVREWYNQPQGAHITQTYAKAMICKIHSDKYCDTLKGYNLLFESTNFVFTDPKRIVHIITGSGYLLQAIKINHTFQKNKKVLYVNPSDDINVQKQVIDAFELPLYTYLILIWPKSIDEYIVRQTIDKLKEILGKYEKKKVVLVMETNDKLDEESVKSIHNYYDIIKESVTFKDLSKYTQDRLLKQKSIVFQGKDVSLEELLATEERVEYADAINWEVLEELVKGEKIIVGKQPSAGYISRYYINRSFKKEEQIVASRSIYEINEKVVLISDCAGMGKSTVLAKLAADIKEDHPHLWVFRIELHSYTKTLRDFLRKKETITVVKLLNSNDATTIKNNLEFFTFSMKEKVVLMFDGVDEICPDYKDLILKLLDRCRQASNFAKIFVTTRPQITQELRKTLKVEPILLEPLTEQNQIDFLKSYWAHNLKLDNTNCEKCVIYAKALIKKMSHWIQLNHYKENHFVAVPLHVRMVAEIFEKNNKVRDKRNWEGCQEYLSSGREEPKLPMKLDIKKLYDMFVDKKLDIFIEKENPSGHVAATHALTAQFNECLAYYRTLALEVIVYKIRCEHFLSYQPQVQENVVTNTQKMGIIQTLDNKLSFIHRTFAEYFAADTLVREMELGNTSAEFQNFLINAVLSDSEFSVTRSFFDSFLEGIVDNLPSNVFCNYQSLQRPVHFESDPFSFEFIHQLAAEGCATVLQLLLKCIDFRIVTDKEVSSKLIYSPSGKYLGLVFRNTLNTLKFLVQQGGVNIKGGRDRTPLHEAARHGHLKTVEFLMKNGALVNIVDSKGRTALHLAIFYGHTDIGRFLVESGVDIQIRDLDGFTAIHIAVSNGYFDIVKYLIEAGCDINVQDKFGRSPLHYAASSVRCEEIRDLARDQENMSGTDKLMPFTSTIPIAKLDLRNGEIYLSDQTMLQSVSVGPERLDIVKFLVESGASLNIKDKWGHSPINDAKLTCHSNILKYLTEYEANNRVRIEAQDDTVIL